ncbi:helix-turn-helix domain-containing protein [Nonomuraea sp. NPDC049421]|uniref:helix-turn-helix domain-containing protein n=1 Tax=Nonomuraea sp. NPDC049421 TaxID=3155275 RepID=UPI0034396809
MFKGDRLTARPRQGITVLTAGCWILLQVGSASTTRQVVDVAAPGDLVDSSYVPYQYRETPHVEGIVLTKGRVLHIAPELVPIAMHDMPGIRTLIHQVQGEKQHFDDQVRAAVRLDIETRLARLLLALLHRFGERQAGGRNVLAPSLSHADLAAWIGVSESSVWRTLRRWRRDGVIGTGYSTLAILNPKEMQKLADSPDMPYAAYPAAARNKRYDGSPGTTGAVVASGLGVGVRVSTDLPPGL